MEKLQCHSGTKKQEVIDFANNNKGSRIELHYENNIYSNWGDDDIFIYNTSDKKKFDELIVAIGTYYIHGIKTIN